MKSVANMNKKIKNLIFLHKTLIFSVTIFLFSFFVFFSPLKAQAALPTVEPIYQVMMPKDGCDSTVKAATGTVKDASLCFTGMGATTVTIWYTIMKVVDSLVLAVLIWVAFMNILRIQLDSYAVKKFLPTFIIAIILANFSFLIARMLLDIGNVAISAFLTGDNAGNVTGAFNGLIKQSPTGPAGFTGNYPGYILVYILKQIFVAVGAVLVAILAFIFLIRNYFLYFLICISPAAFMAMILPITKKYFQQWWSQFLKWVFMPVISVFWLWLAGEFLNTIGPDGSWVLQMGFAGLCLYMAITSPFKAGGAAVGAWANFGKKAWSKTGGAAWNATGGVGVKAAKDYVSFQYGVGKNWAREGARKLPVVRSIDRAIGKGTVTRDLYARKIKKQEEIRKKINIMNFLEDKGPKWLEDVRAKDPVTKGRLKAVFGDLGAEESGPNYKDQFKLKDLAERQLYHRNADGTRERADVYRVSTEPEYRKGIEDYFKVNLMKSKDQGGKGVNLNDPEKRGDEIAAYIASTQEARRRVNNKRLAELEDGSMPEGEVKTIEEFFRKPGEGGYMVTDHRDVSVDRGARVPQSNAERQAAQRARQRAERQPAGAGDDYDAEEEEEESRASSAVPVDMAGIESRLDDINETLKNKGEGGIDSAKTMADMFKPTSVGFGIGHVPELDVQIKGITPAAAEQLKILQTRVARSTGVQAIRMAERQEATLQFVAQELKNGGDPNELERLAKAGQESVARDDLLTAREIALKIDPSAKFETEEK